MTTSTRQDPSSARFVAMALRTPRLSRADEHALAVEWRDERAPKAANSLARSHFRSVVFIALKYRGYGTAMSELIAAGNLGLTHALGKFDPSRGTRFATYADHWVRAYMVRHMIRTRSMVTGGYGALESRLFFRLRREAGRIESMATGKEEAMDALAEDLDVTRERLDLMLRRAQDRDVSLDTPLRDDGEGVAMIDMLSSDLVSQEESFRVRECQTQVKAEVHDAVSTLNEREKYIVAHRLLAEPEDRMTLDALGDHLGVSRERVRQIETAIKGKLQRRLAPRWRESLRDLVVVEDSAEPTAA